MDDVLADFFADIAETAAEHTSPPAEPTPLRDPEESAENGHSVPAGLLSPEELKAQIEQLKQQKQKAAEKPQDPEPASTSSATPAPAPGPAPPGVPAPGPGSASQPPGPAMAPPFFNPSFPNMPPMPGMPFGMRPPMMSAPPQLSMGPPTVMRPPQPGAPPTVQPPLMPSAMPLTLPSANTVTIGGMPVPNPQVTTSARPLAKKSEAHYYRAGAGKVWEDETLKDWPDDDFRIFVGNLGNDVNVDTLSKAFSKYPSFQKAKVVRERRSNKTKGFGFVSFADSQDMIKALTEMNNKYIGNRPVMLKAGKWKDRACDGNVAEKYLKDQRATGWEQKKKRRYHVQGVEPKVG